MYAVCVCSWEALLLNKHYVPPEATLMITHSRLIKCIVSQRLPQKQRPSLSYVFRHPNLCLMCSSQLSSSNLVCIRCSDFGSSVILLMLWLLKCDYWPYRGLSGQYPLKSLNSAEEREEIWPLVNYLQLDVCVPLVWRVEQPESAADTRTMFDRGPIEFSLMSSEERIAFLCHSCWCWYDILVVFVTVVILTLIESPEKKSPLLMSGAIIILLLWNTRLRFLATSVRAVNKTLTV